MPAPDQPTTELALPAFDAGTLARRVALAALLAAAATVAVVLAGGRIHAFADALQRGFDATPGWVAVGVVFEALSLAGYVGLLSLVAGRATPRIGTRESAQITLAGAGATRLLPTAGAGGATTTTARNPFAGAFLEHWSPSGVAPALMLNATSVGDGFCIAGKPF